jgi:(p)ppGpp synthase/HD superfamily hydrolase
VGSERERHGRGREKPATPLGPAFKKALTFASHLHRNQWRKGTQIPYVAHLLAVASLALEHGATENEAIAALLHDALEDHPLDGRTERDIRRKFPAEVLDIVRECSDGTPGGERSAATWRARKEAYLRHLERASHSARLVSACDKLHNARSLLSDYRHVGEKLWTRFNATKEDTLWHYRELVKAFSSPHPTRLSEELDWVVTTLEREVAARARPKKRRAAPKKRPPVTTRRKTTTKTRTKRRVKTRR